MLYIRVSQTRAYFINEYYITIPLALLLEYFLIKRALWYRDQNLKKTRKRSREKFPKLRKKLERLNKRAEPFKKKFQQLNRRAKPFKRKLHQINNIAKQWKILNLAIHMGMSMSIVTMSNLLFQFTMVNLMNAAIGQDIANGAEKRDPFSESEKPEDWGTVTYPNCLVGKGLRFVNNERLRAIIKRRFRNKKINGVIFITKTALCYLAETYGLKVLGRELPDIIEILPIPIKEPVAVSSWFQLARKACVSIAVIVPAPMLIVAQGPFTMVIAGVVALAGGGLVFFGNDPGFTVINTSLIDSSIKLAEIESRIPGLTDVVSVDFSNTSRDSIKIQMDDGTVDETTKKWYECYLSDQKLTNPNCQKPKVEIKTDSDIHDCSDAPLSYEDVVTMRDVTKLSEFNKLEFSDKYEVCGTTDIVKEEDRSPNLRGTTQFLDQFFNDPNDSDMDSSNPDDSEDWDAISDIVDRIREEL